MASPELLLNFIDGSFHTPAELGSRAHHNPALSSQLVSVVSQGSPSDIDFAAGSGAKALRAWRALPGATRAEHLHKFAESVSRNREALVNCVVSEVGKPVSEARGEVARCVAILRYYSIAAVHPIGTVIPAQNAGALQYSLQEPLGVVGLITPWNFPLAIPLWKAAPALAFGNTVVIKSSEFAAACAGMLAQCAAEAGLPAGVLNVVHGEGKSAGEALLSHPAIAGISFTGSRAVGTRVAAVAAARNIRYQTEMGGKNVAIVLRDANLERAATLVAGGAMRYAGQKCTATSRVVVDRTVASEFHAALERKVNELNIGPSTSDSCDVGPLIHAAARDRIVAALKEASGVRVTGGTTPLDPQLAGGNFLTPAIVRGANPDSAIAQEELFGPVVATFEVESIEEAIEIANNTRYGLSAALFTADISAALHYVSAIQAGMVRVNGDTTGVDPYAPFGGVKESSSGSREQGHAAREFYTFTKTVQINP